MIRTTKRLVIRQLARQLTRSLRRPITSGPHNTPKYFHFLTPRCSGLSNALMVRNVPHSRTIFSGSNRLDRLQQGAYANRTDGSKQAAYIKELNKTSPYEVKRYVEKLPASARTEEVNKEYIKALLKIAESPNQTHNGFTTSEGSSGGSSHVTLNLTRPLPVSISGASAEPSIGGALLLQFGRILMAALVFGGIYYLWNNSGSLGGEGGGRGGSLFGFATTTHRLAQKVDVTFDDVKGCDEAKQELVEVVEYLKDPEKFSRLGAKLPKGVLLVGPPGTGKTLLARAVAGEANVPFFYCSGSEFDEVLVGLGTRRIKNLFNDARTAAPAIIFIDEIDALGFSRKNKFTTYKESTLNQLLTELDGFKASDGVILIGATNLPETLDPALTRPGRFDKTVTVPVPDVKGREELFRLYLQKVTIAKDVEPTILARGTPGFTGADISNLINIAAIKATLQGRESVTMDTLEEAKDQVMMGVARSSAFMDKETLRITAYHEGGHTLVALYTNGATPLHKVTIMPRGRALGVTSLLPEGDVYNYSREQALGQVAVALGGRAAEELIFGKEKVTSGASSDFKNATAIAQEMVFRWGMSDRAGMAYRGTSASEVRELSSETRRLLEEEVDGVIQIQYQYVQKLLRERREELERLAAALLEHETLSKEEVLQVISGKKLVRPAKTTPPSSSTSSQGPAHDKRTPQTDKPRPAIVVKNESEKNGR